jgi:disease resistance protein RPM1
MVEAVVGLLVGKLGEAKDELESMKTYLKGAERFKDTDETTGLFVERIRGFAFEIEDVVDEFTYKLDDKHGGFAAREMKRIKHAKTWRRLARKLQDINCRLQGAKQLNQQYAMTQMDGSAGAGAFPANQALNFTRDEDLVGITENKELLTQWLARDLEQGCKIATVGACLVWAKQLWLLMCTKPSNWALMLRHGLPCRKVMMFKSC